jgi:hypothetical protein
MCRRRKPLETGCVKEIYVRSIIIHYHIYKNAGTSVDSLLAASFAGRTGSIEGLHPWSVLGPEDILKYVLENEFKALSTHSARKPLLAHPELSIFPIFFLRHPLVRISSVYEFERRAEFDTPGTVMARKVSFAEYVRWRLEDGVSPIMRNFHTLFLSDAQLTVPDPRCARADITHFAQAKQILESVQYFGIVEEFEKSVLMMQKWLEPYFPEIKLYPSRYENRSLTTRGGCKTPMGSNRATSRVI